MKPLMTARQMRDHIEAGKEALAAHPAAIYAPSLLTNAELAELGPGKIIASSFASGAQISDFTVKADHFGVTSGFGLREEHRLIQEQWRQDQDKKNAMAQGAMALKPQIDDLYPVPHNMRRIILSGRAPMPSMANLLCRNLPIGARQVYAESVDFGRRGNVAVDVLVGWDLKQARLEPGIMLSTDDGRALPAPKVAEQVRDDRNDALAYVLQMAPKGVTTHPTLERVMADAKQAIQDVCGLQIRDGTGAVVFGIDMAGNMTATSVSTDQLYWQDAEQARAFDQAMPSDRDGIEEDMRRELGRMPVPIAKPAPVDTAKPAVAGLGVMASGDHRPGLWRTFD